jgi:hypothetical protein
MTIVKKIPILKNNGFKSYIIDEKPDKLRIAIYSPYEDTLDNDFSRGEYLDFKIKVNELDVCRKARKSGKTIEYILQSYIE